MKKEGHIDAELVFGDDQLVVKKASRSQTQVAKILGNWTDQEGKKHVLLDRLIHAPWHQSIGCQAESWQVAGAYVSELISST